MMTGTLVPGSSSACACSAGICAAGTSVTANVPADGEHPAKGIWVHANLRIFIFNADYQRILHRTCPAVRLVHNSGSRTGSYLAHSFYFKIHGRLFVTGDIYKELLLPVQGIC